MDQQQHLLQKSVNHSHSQNSITKSQAQHNNSTSSLSGEIHIDSIVSQQKDLSASILKQSKVAPTDAFDIQGAEYRLTTYYEMKDRPQSNVTPWWRRQFQKKVNNPLTKLQETEKKQRQLLRDFQFDDPSKIPTFHDRVLESIGQKMNIIEPDSFFYISWQVLNSILVLIFMFEIPFLIFFPIEVGNANETTSAIQYFVVFSILVFIVDVFISFNTAIYYEGMLEYNRKKISQSYLRSCFFQDIIPILSLLAQLLPSKHTVYYVGILFYLKTYEIFKLQETVYNNLRLRRRSVAFYSLASLMLWMIFICHIFACFFFGIGNSLLDVQEVPGEEGIIIITNSWLVRSTLRDDIYKLEIPQQYLYAFYWSVTTMISVGYGDITPKNTPEVLITVFTMFISCILFAYSINSIWEVIRELNENRFKFDKHVTAINRFMYDNGVNRKLNRKINAYIAHMWNADRKRDMESEQIMIKRLAPALKEQLLFETLGLFLQKTNFFQSHFSQDFLRELSFDIEEVRFSEGEVIFLVHNKYIIQFQQDDIQWDDLSLYHIAAGSVEVYLQKGNVSHQLSTMEENELFGWVGFVGGIKRSASVKCLTYSRLYKLPRAKFLQRLESYPKDKQIFHQLRDRYLFENKLEKFNLKCYVCQSMFHLAEDCDKTHFVVKQSTLKDLYKQSNNRTVGYRRKMKPRFNAQCHQRDVVREAKYMKGYSKTMDYDSDGQEEDELELQDVARSKVATDNSMDEEDQIWIDKQATSFRRNESFQSQKQSQSVCMQDQPEVFDLSHSVQQLQLPEVIESESKNEPTSLITQRKRKQSGGVEIKKDTSQQRTQTLHVPSLTPRSKLKNEDQTVPSLTPRTKLRSEDLPPLGRTQTLHSQNVTPIVKLNTVEFPPIQRIRRNSANQIEMKRNIIANMDSGSGFASHQLVPTHQHDTNSVLYKINKLSKQLSGGNLDLLNQIRESLNHNNDYMIEERSDNSFSEVDSDSAFTIDLQHNYTDYFNEFNPTSVINVVKRQQKKQYRKTIRM